MATTLGVSHGRGVVAVERTEAAAAFDEWVSHGERLRNADERIVDRAVTMRVIFTHDIAHDRGALAMLRVGGNVLLPHRVEDAPLDGLEAVADVRQGSRGDDRQR